MRIAWFTPYSRRSAIGKCSRTIVTALAKRHEVQICCFDAEPILESPVPVMRARSAEDWDEVSLRRYDLVIYNFGNHFPFHADIFFLSRRWPGVCILHDFVMHHFFAAYYLEYLKDGDAYVKSVKRLYGDEGENIVVTSISGRGQRIWETDRVGLFPLVEYVVQGAAGVIVHSEFMRTFMAETFAGPLQRLPLPYAIDELPTTKTRLDLGIPEETTLLLTVGHINPNKCVSDVLEALGQVFKSAAKFSYAVVGNCTPEYRKELQRIADRNGISAQVYWMGEVDEETLRAFLQEADICLNLRFPAIEGSSASVIEQMKNGKLVIVNNIGFFAELPDECVVKIEPKDVDILARELCRLVATPELRRRMGQEARQFATREFDADRYAAGVENMSSEINKSFPLLSVADRVAGEFGRMGVAANSETVRSTARELFRLFCGDPPGRMLK